MSYSYRLLTIIRVAAVSAAVTIAGGMSPLLAQTSSSAEYKLAADPDGSGSPALGAASGTQNNGKPVPAYDYPERKGITSHLAAEFGGGWTTPGTDQNDMAYGWNIVAGGGYKFNRKFSLLGEYKFNSSGIPSSVLAQLNEPGGYIHIWSLTVEPVWNIKTSGNWGAYVTGGGGYYRKTTAFTQPALITGYYCDYFYCYPYQYVGNVVTSEFATNQGGFDVGGGFTFGNFSFGKLYTEARYTWLATPGRSTTIIPVTIGLRW